MKKMRNQLINLICEFDSAKVNGIQMAVSSAKLHLKKPVEDCCICMLPVSDGHLCVPYVTCSLKKTGQFSFAAV